MKPTDKNPKRKNSKSKDTLKQGNSDQRDEAKEPDENQNPNKPDRTDAPGERTNGLNTASESEEIVNKDMDYDNLFML